MVLPLVSPNNSGVEIENNIRAFVYDAVELIRDKFVCVYAGSLRPTIKLDLIIESFSELPDDIFLVIAGSSGRLEEYKKLANHNPRIIFLGWLNARELEVIYSVSNLGLAPYINAPYFSMNLTNKPIEYLCHSLPILTSVQGYLSDILEKNLMGYLYDINKKT